MCVKDGLTMKCSCRSGYILNDDRLTCNKSEYQKNWWFCSFIFILSFRCVFFIVFIIVWISLGDIVYLTYYDILLFKLHFDTMFWVKYDTCDITWWALNTHDGVWTRTHTEIGFNLWFEAENPIMGVQRSSGNVTCIVLD